jgi:hypothetical protein
MRSLFGDYRAQMEAEWQEALRALRAGEELEVADLVYLFVEDRGKCLGSGRKKPRAARLVVGDDGLREA